MEQIEREKNDNFEKMAKHSVIGLRQAECHFQPFSIV